MCHFKLYRILVSVVFFFALANSEMVYAQSGDDIRLQYKNNNTSSPGSTIEPHLILHNDGTAGLTLSDVTIRYWFTSEPNGQDVYEMDWAAVGTSDVNGSFGTVNGQRYLEISFTSSANIPGHLGGQGPDAFPAGSNTGEIQNRIHDDGWSNYDQSNDYSFDSGVTSFADYDEITVYYQGSLVWGTPPSGAAEAEEMTITQQPQDGTAGQTLSPSPTVLLEDGQGNPVSGVDITVSLNKSNFTGGSTTIVTTDGSGEAVFDNLALNTSDTGYQLTFDADASMVDDETSNSFDIDPGDADDMTITQQPSNGTAGQALSPSPTVLLEDSQGNPVPGVDVTVTLNKNNFTGGSTTTVTTNGSGEAVFNNLTTNTADTGYELTFDPDASGVSNVSSNSFDVGPDDPDNMTVSTQPSESVTNGVVEGPPAVTVTDAYGNPVSGVDVTVSETGGYPFDAGTLTRTTNTSGVATFNNLEIHTADTGYQLTFNADAAGVSNVTSTSFDVVTAGGSMTVTTQPPSQTTAGSTISPAPTIELLDDQDDPISGVDVTVSLNQNSFASGTYTVQTNGSGIATFNNLVIENAAADYEITFNADQSGVANVFSNTFDVIADDASTMSVTTQPGSTPAGSSVSGPPAVTITDTYGNPVSGVDVSVSLNQNSFASGTTTMSTNSSGVAGFNDLVITTVANGYQLTFDADASGVANATSSSFNVTAAAADKMEVTVQPTESTSGVTISPSPTVLVTDASDNPVSGVDVTVSLNKSNFTGGSTTIVTSNGSGEAVFDNLRINSADTGYEMSFSATGLSSVTSNSFEVVQPDPPFGSIRLQYENNETSTSTSTITPYIRLYNDSSQDINLSDLTVRYWFTSEPPGLDIHEVDWVEMGSESDVNGTFDVSSGQRYLEISFSSSVVIPVGLGGDGSTPDLMPSNATTGVIQQRIRDDGWGTYDQSNDYSFDSSVTSFADYDEITVYYQGSLIWGTPPSGTSDAEEMTITQQPSNGTAGQTLSPSPTVLLEDGQGNPVSGVDVTVSLNKSSFTGGSTTIVTTDGSGEAVFDNLALNTADTGYQLTFDANASLVSDETSNSFNIDPGDPDNMTVTTQPPSQATAGSTISPSPAVTLTDEFGNPTSGVDVTVTLNQNGFASGTTTVSTNSSGVASFSGLMITSAAEGYVMTFDANAAGVSNVNSNTFDVGPDDPDDMTISTQPSESVTNGVVEGPPAVTVTDAYGNPVSGVDVTVSETGGYPFDAGTLTQATNASGVATFNDLEIQTADTDYQLTFNADAAGVSNVTSTSFEVVEITGTMSVTAQPTETVAGDIITPAVSVELVDLQDDPISGVDVTVSLNQNSFASGTYTVQTNGSGIATFNNLVIENAAVDYEITFNADQSGVANVFSNTFDVIADDASTMSVTTQPGNTPTGSSVSGPPAVTITDTYGNPVSGVDVSVSLNQNSFASGTTTVSTNSSGVAGFNDLVITTVANGYQLTFDADASGVANATSSSFNVTAAAADKMEVTVQPTESSSGVTISPSPTVLVTDASDNPVAGVDVTVSLNKSNFTGGSTTIVTSNGSGEAVFDNLRINSADTGYEMSFSATGLSSVTSNSFDVIQANPPFGSIRLQYENNETSTSASAITPYIRLYNDSNLDINLSDLTVRYWFTSEPPGNDIHEVDWVEMGSESDVDGTFGVEDSKRYLEVTFSSSVVIPVGLGGDGSTPDLMPSGASTGVIQQRIRDSSWGTYDQSDDYSFDDSITSFADHEYINVYYKGQLVWGIAPALPEIFYSRQTGDWDEATSWSLSGHSGAVSTVAPSAEDTVVIGGGDTISFTSDVTNDESITIDDTGTLNTGSYTLSGEGSFTLETGGTLQIGSVNGISLDGSTGNIQSEGDISYSQDANYVYNGSSAQVTGDALPVEMNGNLTINNSSGVTADQSYQVNGTLYLTGGSFIFNDGLSLIANDKDVSSGDLTFKLEIDGQAGYRLLSSPIDTDFDNFLSGVLTQGFTGATLGTSFQPNVLWYDETYEGTDNQRWRAPGNVSSNITTARGYHVYMFGSIPEDSNYNESFPYTLEVNGQENEGSGGEVDLNVTYTEDGDNGWNLAGNPYGSAIDWDDASWTKTNMDPTIYIWDPNSNQYDTWNGVTGDITDGLIAPFQGFWVKANDENPQLVVHQDAKSFGGTFVGKLQKHQPNEGVPTISIQAYHSKYLRSSVHFSFHEDGSFSKDKMDAMRLLPPPGVNSYLEFYSRTEEEDRLAINNIPRRFGRTIEVPLELNAYLEGEPMNEEIWLKVTDFQNVPESWKIVLVNEQSGESFPVSGLDSVRVSMNHVTGKSLSKAGGVRGKVTTKSKDHHARFTLRIDPGQDAGGLPTDFELHQNYPNPFNSTTTLQFNLPVESDVRLEIYDITGRRVANLVDTTLPSGAYHQTWNASGLASGIYITRLVTNEGVFIKKLTLLK